MISRLSRQRVVTPNHSLELLHKSEGSAANIIVVEIVTGDAHKLLRCSNSLRPLHQSALLKFPGGKTCHFGSVAYSASSY